MKPAVANDGGDIKFLNYKDGVVKVKLQGAALVVLVQQLL